ncbi:MULTISPECIES: cytidine deaminase [unclassified Pseudoalteromonas]|uniref:cytidine deaminase n=1 Tax=unclassified Pseudoalteromonas TaxID=194690 RepID=UPI0005A5FFCC|nr:MULTISPECIES: cytidine deaminase [unclassified Pseudoalteromonas]
MILSSPNQKINFSTSHILDINSLLKNTSGMLNSQFISKLKSELDTSLDDLLTALLPFASEFSVAPISNFYVGAIAVGSSGNLYFGANLEFTNQALSLVLHGEQSAISNAWLHGETHITKLAINAAPCGYCRQFINELACAHHIEILLNGEVIAFDKFLPMSFGPKDLGNDFGLLTLKENLKNSEKPDSISSELFQQISLSYAPYSNNLAACEIQTFDGQVFYGRYAENAAYSPSLSPLQAAISQLILSGNAFSKEVIKQVTLVEMENIENQLSVTKAVLESYDFKVPFNYVLLGNNT